MGEMLRKMAEEEEGDDEDEDEDDEDSEKEEDKDEDEDEDDEDEDDKAVDEESTYSKFYKEFGRSVKLGVIEDTKNKKKLLKLLRFNSMNSPDKLISLEGYVDAMPDNQKHIYYISAANMEEAKMSPFLERCKSKNFDGLYFGDGKDGEKWKEDKTEEFQPLVDFLKDLYGDKVNKVATSMRLVNSPRRCHHQVWSQC